MPCKERPEKLTQTNSPSYRIGIPAVWFLALWVLSCWTTSELARGRNKIVRVGPEDSGSWGHTWIDYKSPRQLEDELAKEAQLKMWSESEVAKRRCWIPAGGEVVVHISRGTLGSANTRWFTVIVKDGDRELVRRQGEEDIPDWNPPSLYDRSATSGEWWNLMVVSIPEPLERPINVYVIDDILKKRFEWTVIPEDLPSQQPDK
ncbi:MAG: hypothetical protein ABIK62_06505 [candidate division WOR-3 bacterium]